MRTVHGASSRQIEAGRGQAPADRARPVSSGLLSPRRKQQERDRRAAAVANECGHRNDLASPLIGLEADRFDPIENAPEE